jgi:hypothetical protein
MHDDFSQTQTFQGNEFEFIITYDKCERGDNKWLVAALKWAGLDILAVRPIANCRSQKLANKIVSDLIGKSY